jgi:hypothetical protein
MNVNYSPKHRFQSPIAVLLSALLGVPFFSYIAMRRSIAASPPVENTSTLTQATPIAQLRDRTPQRTQRRGLSNRQKVAVLVGAAALYYLWQQHKNRQGQGAQGQYYLSKNGRVYYRDAQGRAHWVTPPPGGIRVPEAEAERYRDFQGYNGRPTGRDLRDLQQAY